MVKFGSAEAAYKAWQTRRGRYGPYGRALTTHCKRGHAFAGDNLRILTNGARRCMACSRIRAREWRAKQNPMPQAIVPVGMTTMQLASRKSCATKRERYGCGQSPSQREAVSKTMRHLALVGQHPRQRVNTCKNGHPLSAKVPSRRHRLGYYRCCMICKRERDRINKRRHRNGFKRPRPLWAEVRTEMGVARVSVRAHDQYFLRRMRPLWEARLTAHPDNGGTIAKFRDADRRWKRTLARESKWYEEIGLEPPSVRRVPVRRAA